MTKKAYTLYRAKAVNSLFFFAFSIFLSTATSQGQSTDKKPVATQASVLQTLVDVNFQNAPIEEVLKAITSKYKIAFTYVNNEIPLSKKVTLKLIKQPLSKVLEVLFTNQSIVYQEIGTQVVLKKKEAVPLVNTEKTPTLATKGQALASTQKKDSLAGSTSPSSPIFNNKNEGKGKFSFSFFKRKKKPIYKPSLGPRPLDSSSLAKDSLEKKNKPISKKAKEVVVAKKPWAIGVHLSPEMTHRFLSGKEKSVEARNGIEKRGIGSTFGVSVDRVIKEPFYFRTGISVLTFKEKASYSSPKPYLPPPPQRGPGYSTDTLLSYSNTYRFLGFPFLLGFTKGDQWFVSVNTGFMPTIFLNTKTTYSAKSDVLPTYPEDYVPNPEKKPPPPPLKKKGPGGRAESDYYYDKELDLQNRTFRTIGLAYVLNIEGGYKIDDRLRVSVSPVFKCFLTSIQSDKKETKERPYSFGLSFAAYYSF